ncbi:DUF3108 domain-containing protein [Microvirga makkahensis]|uniref:DUF3108 domain-containing protein n=1 Tax=Microvirga makkahensis TaxID=1128670 RepID=A0A7X3SNI6_9HYPH|nr:DUF3108 domain-containing protein [Microvirga makkahensis]MXQ11238.1 DUF3108 domain-containing protein [Microvirga makkahensis]
MRFTASALLALGLTGIPFQVQAQPAQTLRVNYSLSLAGLPLGKADLSSTFSGPKYEMQGSVKLTGLVRMITGGKGAGTASGTIVGSQLQSEGFAVNTKSSGERRVVRMALDGGNVAEVEIEPPIEPKEGRVPVKAADKKGVLDPLSALIMPAMASKGLTDAANCNRTIPVFDGTARQNIVLSYSETKTVKVPGYSGPVLVCNARWVPISGHRPQRSTIKFMQENKDMNVWLAPVEGARVLFPIKVAVRTMIGMGELEAASWTVEGGGAATAAKRGVRGREPVRAGGGQ